MINVVAHRHQYGVGQGNFHVQTLEFSGTGNAKLTYRFVYDCGGYPKAVKWCVDHAAPGPERLQIDAVYVSHFEYDHVNGLTALCAKADVKRIYVPFLDEAQAIHIIAMHIAGADGWSVELQNFVSMVAAVATGGSISGVPVTRIKGGERPRAPEATRPREASLSSERNTAFEVVTPTGDIESHSKKSTISVSGLGTESNVEIWELVHWYYAAHKDITNEISSALKEAFEEFESDIEPGLKSGADPSKIAKALNWIQKNFEAIADVYVEVMNQQNKARVHAELPKMPKNHNVASLCLYSGPIPRALQHDHYSSTSHPHPLGSFLMQILFKSPYRDGPHFRAAWLATGDAMLKKPEIWKDFEAHYSKQRLDGCLTVQIPHHGADAPSSDNWNPELIREHQNCVVSAGAYSKDRHPHKNVINAILTKPAMLQLVNENNPLGFIECVKYQSK